MTLPEPLARLAATPRLLVALDFDGTLAPLVDEPMSARMTPDAAAAVAALQSAPDTTVAFVSGRSIDDLRVIAQHDDASSIVLAGSHGAQWWHPPGARRLDDAAETASDAEAAALRDGLRSAAEAAVAGLDGVWIEPKAFGFGVHTRLASPADADEAHARVAALMADRAPGWRRRTGHSVSEYAYRTEGKDSAVAALRELTGATGVVFAGDDVTDEDALRSLGPDDVGIRVGEGETAARLRVADTGELARLLTTLARQRIASRQ